jgi:hypothetical protein
VNYDREVRAYCDTDRDDAITLFEAGNAQHHSTNTMVHLDAYMRRARMLRQIGQ